MFHIALENHLCSRSFDNGRLAGILLVMSIINLNINIQLQKNIHYLQFITAVPWGGSVAEWLACTGLRRRRARVQIADATLSSNSLRQTVHTHCASVHKTAKLVATLLRVGGVTAGLEESNGSLYRRVYDSRHLQADCQEPGSAPQPYAW